MSLRDNLIFKPFNGVKFKEKLPRFGYTFDEKTGERVFKQIGEIDQQANIDSELASCDYSLLMQSLTSSMSDFNFDEFVDSLPSYDRSDPMQLIVARENLQLAYENLPKEVKAKYENNSRKFADSIIGGEFSDLFASWQPVEVDKSRSKGDLSDLEKKVEQLAADLIGMRGSSNGADGAASNPDKGSVGGEKE